jgi:hypothetical protein
MPFFFHSTAPSVTYYVADKDALKRGNYRLIAIGSVLLPCFRVFFSEERKLFISTICKVLFNSTLGTNVIAKILTRCAIKKSDYQRSNAPPQPLLTPFVRPLR